MKMHFFVVLILFSCTFVMFSCKKEQANGNGTQAVFSYVVDGFKANFTNFTTKAQTFSWDFGDGSDSSHLRNPVHIYHQKGQYLVSLAVTNGSESSTFTDTVLIQGPNIKVDGDFADWENVEYNFVNDDSIGGTVRAVKAFASGENIYFYVEGTDQMNLAVMDLYIDADNQPETGFSTWYYPVGCGADFMCEGFYNQDNPNLTSGSVYEHTGDPADFSWNALFEFSEVMKFSKMVQSNGTRALEFSIQRKALGTLKSYVNFGLLDNNASYILEGSIPAAQTPTSKLSPIKL